MKKIDILKIMSMYNTLKSNYLLLSPLEYKRWSEGEKNRYQPEKNWFPNIPDFNEQFDILKQEILEKIEQTSKYEKEIKRMSCTHEVRLQYAGSLIGWNECVLCGSNISAKNVINFKESSYRNKHTVTFTAKNQTDDMNYPIVIETGTTEEEIQKMIISILENYNDEDEIDLVEEFNKLKLKNVEINIEKRKEEAYILIIGGTNIEYFDNEKGFYLAKNKQLQSINFFKYFSYLANVKLAYIENDEVIKNKEFRESTKSQDNLYLQSYSTLSSIEEQLKILDKIPFKLIIDISELYDYSIQDNNINTINHNLNLNELFPNSTIVKIRYLSRSDEFRTIRKLLMAFKNDANIPIIYNKYDSKFYFKNEVDKIEKTECEETCDYIKKQLIIKKTNLS